MFSTRRLGLTAIVSIVAERERAQILSGIVGKEIHRVEFLLDGSLLSDVVCGIGQSQQINRIEYSGHFTGGAMERLGQDSLLRKLTGKGFV